MLEIHEALANMLAATTAKTTARSTAIESCLLTDSVGRFLANDVIATINVPPADNSAMDGYAINTADITSYPATLPISQRIPAGSAPQPLIKGTAARIYTGAETPQHSNAVAMQENCELLTCDDEGYDEKVPHVRILQAANPQENVRSCGQDIAIGSTVLKKHKKITPQDIGLLASIGIANITVFTRLKVAFVGTGDELVMPGTPLKAGQIYNSNQPMLMAILEDMGCEIVANNWVEDTLAATINALNDAAQIADIVITIGGVSVGDEDHVKNAVATLGQVDLWKINIKPGKPIAFGHIHDAIFIGLPGNPVSAYITLLLFGKPVIETCQGGIYQEVAPLHLPAQFEINKPQRRPEFLRVKMGPHGVESYPNQSSGVLSSVCWADALALVPASTTITKNDIVQVWPLKLL